MHPPESIHSGPTQAAAPSSDPASSAVPQLPAAVLAYLDELAADIAANGGLEGKSIEVEIAAAHQRRSRFHDEILHGRTLRAQMILRLLCARVYADLVAKATADRAIEQCEDLYNQASLDGARRSLGL